METNETKKIKLNKDNNESNNIPSDLIKDIKEVSETNVSNDETNNDTNAKTEEPKINNDKNNNNDKNANGSDNVNSDNGNNKKDDANNISSNKKEFNWPIFIIAIIGAILIVALGVVLSLNIRNNNFSIGDSTSIADDNSTISTESSSKEEINYSTGDPMIDAANSQLEILKGEYGVNINYDGLCKMIEDQIESKIAFINEDLGWDVLTDFEEHDENVRYVKAGMDSFTKKIDENETINGKNLFNIQGKIKYCLFFNGTFRMNDIGDTSESLEEGVIRLDSLNDIYSEWLKNGHESIGVIESMEINIPEDPKSYDDLYYVVVEAKIKTTTGNYLIPLANESNDEGYNGYVVLDVIKI